LSTAVPVLADPFDTLVGSSRPLRDAIEVLRLVAPRHCTILITGRTGTGKELAARAVHEASARRRRDLVSVNCGAIPKDLVESEFFGHVKGAFTGAAVSRAGRFEQAHGGTLFLDEVGELPSEIQAKLLRALQEGEIQRVGSSETTRVDVRIVAATNRDLSRMVENGQFREDLYYRLNVVPIRLPDLVERIDDLPAIAGHLLQQTCGRERLVCKSISDGAMAQLCEYDWPGNVRQLQNSIEKAVAMSGERMVLSESDFQVAEVPRTAGDVQMPALQVPIHGINYDAVVSAFERDLLSQAIALAGGNKKRAAELLQLKRTTFLARWKTLQEAAA
jgi:transcriptional regulator with GAF, ATPase, and Fis domain